MNRQLSTIQLLTPLPPMTTIDRDVKALPAIAPQLPPQIQSRSDTVRFGYKPDLYGACTVCDELIIGRDTGCQAMVC